MLKWASLKDSSENLRSTSLLLRINRAVGRANFGASCYRKWHSSCLVFNMDVNSIAKNQMLTDYRRTNRRLSLSLSRITSGERATKVQDDPVTWNQVERLKTNASNLQGYTDNLHRAAATVKIALDSMSVAQAHMGQAEEKLVAAFEAAPGSYERSNALNAYNGLVDLEFRHGFTTQMRSSTTGTTRRCSRVGSRLATTNNTTGWPHQWC